ncbi:MAG: MmcB family DNA repair protein [Pseudomonadota bacterium]|nr:MmcB family DNA repair protein [Pseudomonadota bacterium]
MTDHGFAKDDADDLLEILDGRQSEAAAAIQRGTCRLMRALGHSVICELPLASGHRADIMSLGRSGEIWITEIKSSLADFRADAKWHFYRDWCDRLFFAVDADFPLDVLPDETGLVIADRFGAELMREAPEHRLAGGRRKAVTLRFARAAALRLHGLTDQGVKGFTGE